MSEPQAEPLNLRTAHVGLIGIPQIPAQFGQNARLISNENLDSFDVIIWDPRSLDYELKASGHSSVGLSGNWSHSHWNSFSEVLNNRAGRLLNLVFAGKILFIVNSKPLPNFVIVEGKKEKLRFPISEYLICDAAAGRLPTYSGPSINGIWRNGERVDLPYSLQLLHESIQSLFIAQSPLDGEDLVVGGYIVPRGASGMIVLIPPNDNWNSTHPDHAGERLLYLNRIAYVVASLPRSEVAPTAPEWANTVHLEEEHLLAKKLGGIENDIQKLKSQAEQTKDALTASDWQKHLLCEDGTVLEEAVKRAFSDSGIHIKNGPKSHADLLGRHGDTILVFEVKGYDGATRAAAASQCQRWISDVEVALRSPAEERDEVCKRYAGVLAMLGIELPIEDDDFSLSVKGIVVANTYRKLPIHERPAENFPNALHAPIKRYELAAMTGLQVLGMYAACRKSPDKANEVFDRLVSTTGIYSEFDDWQSFLKITG